MKDNIIPSRSISSPQKQKHIRCVACDKKLTGRQTKFCSKQCKFRDNNIKFQNYQAQKDRALDRKLKLVEMLGGKCCRCGYQKNLASLCFHHDSGKDFALDSRSLSNRNWDRIETEIKRCILLCHNCHMEEHYPEYALPYT